MEQESAHTMGLMREVPDAYGPFYHARGISVSTDLARVQHQAYARALRTAGVEVHRVAADEAFPDCVFVEDPAVVWPGHALIARMASHREGEQPPVARALGQWHEIVSLPEGARLEGGDVLHVGDCTYVGLTTRTNARGADALRDFISGAGRRVVPVPVSRYLHLKSAVTYLGNGTLVAAPDCDGLRAFDIDCVLEVAAGETAAANCLRVGDHLLIPAGNPRTEIRLRAFAERHGVTVMPLDISEFEKGEGSLTCLSIIW